MNKKAKTDLLSIIAVIIVIIGLAIIVYHYKSNDCAKDPVKFIVRGFSKMDDVNYSYLEIKMYLNKGDDVPYRTHTIDLEGPYSFKNFK